MMGAKLLQVEATNDRYFDLEGLSDYSGISTRTLRRYMRDEDHPLPHYCIRAGGKDRGLVLVAKSEFDVWVRSFGPSPRRADDLSIDERVSRALAKGR
jgi:hypothetical protein